VYWYVCKIKKDCDKQTTEVVSDQNNKNENFKIKDTVSVINNLTEKLSNGYTLNNFPKNSFVNSHIENNFTEFAENLKIYFEKNTSDKILITGYTDNTGTPQTNIFVGKNRAEFLKKELIEQGIDKTRIQTSSKGQANPIADNNTEEGRKLNRRVEITIINN
ncbi:MAG: OmpA family protein, partial [Bacteroidales bacterium]|nr:OmpA family protein [Bacteroidales bacterium]